MVEAFNEDEWTRPGDGAPHLGSRRRLSKVLRMKGITHYTIPFKDRPEISILYEGSDSR